MLSQYHLIIDGTRSHEPVFLLCDENSGKSELLDRSQFESEYGKLTLDSIEGSRVKFLVPVIDCDFIPNDFFDTALLAQYGNFILDDGVSPLLDRTVSALGAQLVYRESLAALSQLIHLFPQAERIPFPAAFLETLQLKQPTYGDEFVGIHVAHDFVAIAVFQQKGFNYYREFQINNIDEFNYYFIKVMALMAKDPDQISMVLSGHIDQNDPFHQRVTKYSTNIHFIPQLSCASLVAGTRD